MMMTPVRDVAEMGICTQVGVEPCCVCGEGFPTYMMRIRMTRKLTSAGVRPVAVYLCNDCEDEALSSATLAEAA